MFLIKRTRWLDDSSCQNFLFNCLTLIWRGADNFTPLSFCSIQLHFIRDARAKFGSPYLSQSLDIGQNSDRGISDFPISAQSLIKRNCHNSRTNYDIDMKLGPVIRLDKRNKTTSKNLTMASCRKFVTSLPLFQLTANLEQSRSRIPDA